MPDRIEVLAERILRSSPRLGRTRLVVVDGPAGSGKTTFAAGLATAIERAASPAPTVRVIHMDDLYEGWDGLEGSWDRLAEGVLAPIAQGRGGRYRRYDWALRRFAEHHHVPVPDVLVVEGCGSGRRDAAPAATLIVWVEAPPDVRLARGLARDGEQLRARWEQWMRDEERHFAAEGTRSRADVHIDGRGDPGGR